MPPRFSSPPRQRSKSMPPKMPGAFQQRRLMDLKSSRSKGGHQLKQQLRMTTIDQGKVSPTKPQSKSTEISKILTEFSKILSNLQLTNSDHYDINKTIKEMKDSSMNFPRLSAIRHEQKISFFTKWNSLKNQILEKIEKKDENGKPLTYETAARQLHDAKNSLEKVQQKLTSTNKAQVLETLYDTFDEIEMNIRNLASSAKTEDPKMKQQNQEMVNEIQTDLRRLQSAVPTGKSNQMIGKVILELNLIQNLNRTRQSANNHIIQTEKLLNELFNDTNHNELSRSPKSPKSSTSPTSNKKRSKSLGPSDNRSHVSGTSRKSISSFYGNTNYSSSNLNGGGNSLSRKMNELDHKTSELRNQYVSLDRGMNILREKILTSQRENDSLQKQLEELSDSHSQKRNDLQHRIKQRFKKLGNPEMNEIEENEASIYIERQNHRSLRQRLEMIDSKDYKEMNDSTIQMKNKLHYFEDRIEELNKELERSIGVHSSLKHLQSNPEEIGMDVKMDNHSLKKETDNIRADIHKKQRSINFWVQSLYKDSSSTSNGSPKKETASNDISSQFYQKLELDQESLKKWKEEIETELSQEEQTSNFLKDSEPRQDFSESLRTIISELEQLKHQFQHQNHHQNAFNNTLNNSFNNKLNEQENQKKYIHMISSQIKMNQHEIQRLESQVSEEKSESILVEEQRTQNRQMIDWGWEVLEQIKEALNTQNALQAQLKSEDSKLDKAIERLSDANFKRSTYRTEHIDIDEQLQQVYFQLFGEQPENKFEELFPFIRKHVLDLVEYRRLLSEHEHLTRQSNHSDQLKNSNHSFHSSDSYDNEM
ncbi:hypothetical protein TRFO_04133 [Tritrichomonas foetus]|uniref:Uncharacterized protein n=1 Tax=Tritrichomonas foetus TaxID=1144522 RepID=A0A1J4KGV0_9EUKA|nr:hypothetical protein TRFO_04133 [Tritrichomonas foetus]|eukprot:OHT10639.1 hypothetical protein TRFO_04133 [Tritrichomonas foetus]